MNTTELEIAVIQEVTAEQTKAALKELNQLQLAMIGGGAGETILA
jgi:hypothetical protein